MPFAAIRGASALAEEIKLEAHLASLLKLENIGLLLGAGASVATGGLTMIAIWVEFVRAWPQEAAWMVEHGFIDAGALPEPHFADDDKTSKARKSGLQLSLTSPERS
jgi:hypothetical protein